MQRTQIYLTEDEQAAIRQLSVRMGSTQSAIIRTAIDQFISQNNQPTGSAERMAVFGLWQNHDDIPSLETLRAEERFSA